MGQYIYQTLEELDNVLMTLIPPGSGDPNPPDQTLPSAEELQDGTWLLKVPDEMDAAVQAIDPTRPPISVLIQETNMQRNAALDGGMDFQSNNYQTRPQDRENIDRAGQSASLAISQEGAQPGDTMWHHGTEPFFWIASDNSRIEMDAQTMVLFSQEAASYHSRITISARTVKDQINAGQITQIDQIHDALIANIPATDVRAPVYFAPPQRP